MTQHELIKKFLECVRNANAARKPTPAAKIPLYSDVDGPCHDEHWECTSAIGMLMCLAGNVCPEIQFAVHQCARFTHTPRRSHAIAVKRIARHLVGVLEDKEGLHFKTIDDLNLDLCVDADNDQDPVCVKSCTGYVMTLGDSPISWTSKLKTEVAMSTLEVKYIAMAQAMREFVPLRRMFDETVSKFTSLTKSHVFEHNNGCIATAEALSCLLAPSTLLPSVILCRITSTRIPPMLSRKNILFF